MKNNLLITFVAFLCLYTMSSWALESRLNTTIIITDIYTTESSPKKIGTISAQNVTGGLLLTPRINANSFITPGSHGFHIHINPSCDNSGQAAGGHFDPQNTKSHQGPYKNGHLGDLPTLYAAADGSINKAVIAPRLKLRDIYNHSFMIHEGSDNYSDIPLPLGGGGARKACGIIIKK